MFVLLSRFQDAQREVQRLTERVQFLESLLVKQAQGITDSILLKQGCYTPAETEKLREQAEQPIIEEERPFGADWSAVDWHMYNNYARDIGQAFPSLDSEAIERRYTADYGENLPSVVLL